MDANVPNIVDWLTLAAAASGTFLTAALSVWTTRRKEREVFDAHIEWDWFGSGPIAELPFVYLHNRSENLISVIDVSWASGTLLYLYPVEGTALHYEDPGDIGFPYEVKPGETIKIYLESHGAMKALERAGVAGKLRGLLKISSVYLSIRTLRGTVKLVPGERAIPWGERPEWLTGKKALEHVEEE